MVTIGLAENFKFPEAETADAEGLVAITDRMTPEMVLQAYRLGIFPWSTDPVCWFSPDPRAVFVKDHIHLPSNLPKIIRKQGFTTTVNKAFTEVMQACADVHEAEGVWISEEFIDVYSELHTMGFAKSVEVWQNEKLVGGIYGVQIKRFFAGESMFHTVSNASKVAFAGLLKELEQSENILFDAQVINDHTERLGALLMDRTTYLKLLAEALS